MKSETQKKYLLKKNVKFNKWPNKKNLTRFVASWDTKQSEINNLKKITKTQVIALGGVSKNNIKKLKLINCFGFAGITYFK